MATRIIGSNATMALPALTWRKPSRRRGVMISSIIFLLLLVDAIINSRAFFDLHVSQSVQGVEFVGLKTFFTAITDLTGSTGAIVMWGIAMLAFILKRVWSAAVALVFLPAGGILNEFVGTVLVDRTRPHVDSLERTSSNFAEHSFPSGHVMGAVLFYGLIFFLARRIANRPLRLAIQLTSAAVLATVGIARIWQGADWSSDVLGAYALGGLLLVGLVELTERLQETDGLPLFRAGTQHHEEDAPHAHALTSLVLFHGSTVSKIYNPGLLPRLLYFAAFQASFPYVANRHAMDAASARRNLAAKLTEAWFGQSRVARVTGIERHGDRLAIVSERVHGSEPVDRARARQFLSTLTAQFDAFGLPTWQIDPRQPRAIDNLLESEDGSYKVVDLESGLVSPLASLRYWKTAIRKGDVPFFDDIQFGRLQQAIATNRAGMADQMGKAWVSELDSLVTEAAEATAAWHSSEPRLVNRGVRFVLTGFGLITLYRKGRSLWAGGNEKATKWMSGAVDRWESEGRLNAEQIATVRMQMDEPTFQELVPYLGGHILLSIPLRFPFGCIIRPILVVGALGLAFVRRLRGQIDAAAWQRARTIHSPAVMFVAAIPGAGSLAYVAAKPVRSNRLLMRILGDAALAKIPFKLYLRSGMRRFVVLPPVDDRSDAFERQCGIGSMRQEPLMAA